MTAAHYRVLHPATDKLPNSCWYLLVCISLDACWVNKAWHFLCFPNCSSLPDCPLCPGWIETSGWVCLSVINAPQVPVSPPEWWTSGRWSGERLSPVQASSRSSVIKLQQINVVEEKASPPAGCWVKVLKLTSRKKQNLEDWRQRVNLWLVTVNSHFLTARNFYGSWNLFRNQAGFSVHLDR